MITLQSTPHTIVNGSPVPRQGDEQKTLAMKIISAHQTRPADAQGQHIKFDGMLSHDITYVGITQTARACGLTQFPIPYALTNCHNSLCAVGGTINEDDHVFGLTAAKRYGGIYVPSNMAVIHQYAREAMAACGKMILGSDSHTRYGALGCMGIGEGGPELVKQLLNKSYDVQTPEVVLIWLTGALKQGVGPHDVAIALCGSVYKNNFVKNKVLEFAGPGVAALPIDTRLGIDVMTTETACLSSIWITDETVQKYYRIHGRADAYAPLSLEEGAGYAAMIEIDLSKIEPMIALPYHPSNAYLLREFIPNAKDILSDLGIAGIENVKNGEVYVGQGIIAGCAGGMYENLRQAAAILHGHGTGCSAFSLSAYPSSVPQQLALTRDGSIATLLEAGALIKPCFCGPCFGAGDVPSNAALSIRHTTRNFQSREGARPMDGQSAFVALMDARSIAATARNQGLLTSATDIKYEAPAPFDYVFDPKPYEQRVYNGFGHPDAAVELHTAPSIAPWPDIPAMKDNLLVRLCAVIHDTVTTTDELIPSGETSSYRSNPMKLASFTLSRREPEYVKRAQATLTMDTKRIFQRARASAHDTLIGSAIYCTKPGDGSAREQAASCQRVLGASANICREFATKRYRSNVINWGMLPFTYDADFPGNVGDWIYLPGIRAAVETGITNVQGLLFTETGVSPITLKLENLTSEDRQILLNGCLMNYYKSENQSQK